MASLSSFPFSIEGAAEGSASARSRLLAAIGQGRPLESVSFTNWRNGSVRVLRRSVRAVGRDSVVGDGRERDSEALIQETIEKSKKVLAVQRELLQQIAERRKLVASIKNGTSDVVGGRGLPQESENSSPSRPDEESGMHSSSRNSDVNGGSSDSPVSDQVYANGSPPGPAPSTPSELPANPASGFSDISGGSEGGPTGVEQEKIPSNDRSSLNSGSAVKSDKMSSTLPAFLSLTYESSIPENVLEESMAENLPSDTDEPVPEDAKPPPLAGANVMNVILVAAECAPFSKTGGLGDVAGSLPKALARRGHRVMVVAPKYGNYPEAQEIGVRKRYMVAGQDVEVSYFHAYIDGVDFVFIDNHMFHGIEKNIYGGTRTEILKRMVLFCKASAEVPWHVPCGGVCYGDGNLVFIANDWHTALLPVYLKAYYREKDLMTYTRSVLVIHNIAHQGRGPLSDFTFTDLPEHWLANFDLFDPVGGGHFNILAAGLKAADRIVTVSHGYAWEIRTLEGGRGLHNVIKENDWKLKGIVNGIDTKEWSPEYDIHLQSDGYTNYSVETLRTGKAQCKAALQKELGLPQREEVPLIGFIGRLDDQKGVDLIAEAVPWMMGQDVQLVMLGTGKPDLEQMLRQFEGQYYDKARGWVGFSVKTAHRITAGADILLMPSRFEPCGLNQLYAMNYGTIPVVHAVGGLKDTVLPFDPYNDKGFGYTFDRAESGKLIEALGNCLLTYREYKESWEGLQMRAMTQDLSWDHAAEIYEQVLVAAKYQW